MADAGSGIFNKRATEKLRSPDDLDKFVRVTNPSVWIALVACIALLVGLLSWGLFGAVTTSVSATSVSIDEDIICFLNADNAAKVHTGDTASVSGHRMEVKSISKTPLSREEAHNVLQNDYLVSTLVEGDWAYLVIFSGDNDFDPGVPLATNITVERVSPISLILKGQSS